MSLTIDTLKKIKSSKLFPEKLLSTIGTFYLIIILFLGIIVDSTNPHRKDVKKDYCMRLKIIDPTYNNE